jgi:hypothetical protein
MEQRDIRVRNKGGRPKVAVKKDQMIPVKCSSIEKIILKGKARAVGLTTSEFLRKLGLDGKIDRQETSYPKEILQYIKLLNNAASNINQISKKLNLTGQFTPYWQQQLGYHLGELKKMEQQINSCYQ